MLTSLIRFYLRIFSSKRGQATFEYIFLLAAIMFISIAMLKGINGNLGKVWLYFINQIAYPTTGIDFNP
jgi:hypothetical protein